MVKKPSVYLEQYEVKEDGRQLEFVKETLLLQKDGSSFNIGHLDDAPEFLSEISLSINGQALFINNNDANKSMIFDVQTGKLIFEEQNSSEFEKMEISFNPYTG